MDLDPNFNQRMVDIAKDHVVEVYYLSAAFEEHFFALTEEDLYIVTEVITGTHFAEEYSYDRDNLNSDAIVIDHGPKWMNDYYNGRV